ncbi:MAG: ATP-binding protein [Oscillospiraceae bacterium]|jgi:DNA replication protein DnaC|nr:ATP-binding protein [Oscillospiraceae bacterium]
MALDGKILAQAKAALEKKRRQNDERLERCLQKVYDKSPRVRVIDTMLRETMSDLVGVTLGADPSLQIEDIRSRNLELQEERQLEILRAGFPANYLDGEQICKKCNDAGYINARICSCLMDEYKREQKASLSNLFKLGDETFDSFDLSYYDDIYTPESSISPRRSMEIVYETCIEYARKFGNNSMNLFFNGAPGLGKTFLSACIARVVADKGYSVVYEMAVAAFAKFETVKFMRSHESEESRAEVISARTEVKRYLECDLLIIDDLGTEMTTSFTLEALYEIINTRLITSKKTLINSNLTLDELRRRYSEQIMSRLEWEYQVLTFYGDDIRRKKNAY